MLQSYKRSRIQRLYVNELQIDHLFVWLINQVTLPPPSRLPLNRKEGF
jgi:hypothetical protein